METVYNTIFIWVSFFILSLSLSFPVPLPCLPMATNMVHRCVNFSLLIYSFLHWQMALNVLNGMLLKFTIKWRETTIEFTENVKILFIHCIPLSLGNTPPFPKKKEMKSMLWLKINWFKSSDTNKTIKKQQQQQNRVKRHRENELLLVEVIREHKKKLTEIYEKDFVKWNDDKKKNHHIIEEQRTE